MNLFKFNEPTVSRLLDPLLLLFPLPLIHLHLLPVEVLLLLTDLLPARELALTIINKIERLSNNYLQKTVNVRAC